MARKLPEINPLTFLPVEYEDRRRAIPVSEFRENEKIFTLGVPLDIHADGKETTVNMKGIGGDFIVKFFRPLNAYLTAFFSPCKDRRVLLRGAPKKEPDGAWCFYHSEALTDEEVGSIVPVYGRISGVSNKRLRAHVWAATVRLINEITDEIAGEVLRKRGLPVIANALRQVHDPKSSMPGEASFLRLAYREMFEIKKQMLAFPKNPAPPIKCDMAPFYGKLPFELTASQVKATEEILEDMSRDTGMRRILAGGIASGKTEVVIACAYAALQCSCRTLVLSPTTAQARQTYGKFMEVLGADIVNLYTGDQKESPPMVIIGTRTLLKRQFPGVGLVLLEEQHKCRVSQKNIPLGNVHALQLTSTPIPGAMGLLLDGAIGISSLKEAPFKPDDLDQEEWVNVFGMAMSSNHHPLLRMESYEKAAQWVNEDVESQPLIGAA